MSLSTAQADYCIKRYHPCITQLRQHMCVGREMSCTIASMIMQKICCAITNNTFSSEHPVLIYYNQNKMTKLQFISNI